MPNESELARAFGIVAEDATDAYRSALRLVLRMHAVYVNLGAATNTDAESVADVALKKIQWAFIADRRNSRTQLPLITVEGALLVLVAQGAACFCCGRRMMLRHYRRGSMAQWTIGRVFNEFGHVLCNCVAVCLRCNIRRRERAVAEALHSEAAARAHDLLARSDPEACVTYPFKLGGGEAAPVDRSALVAVLEQNVAKHELNRNSPMWAMLATLV